MSDKSNKQLLVSGPENVIRVEGKIGDVKKILYLFFDVHFPLMSQTHCNEDKIYDSVNYFVDNFEENSSDKINFFLEIESAIERNEVSFNENRNAINPTFRTELYNMHLERVRNFFVRHFNFDPKTNRVLPSKFYKNIYFHFTDLRWSSARIMNLYQDILNSMNNSGINNLYILNEQLIVLYQYINTDYNFIYNTSQDNAKKRIRGENNIEPKMVDLQKIRQMSDYDVSTLMYKYIYKILYGINNPDVKKVVSQLINSTIKKEFEKAMDLLNDVIDKCIKMDNMQQDYIKKNGKIYSFDCKKSLSYGRTDKEDNDFIHEIKSKFLEAYENICFAHIELIDCYFLRRFLDKDYATKNIVYSGGFHCSNYVAILVKYFGFEITNYSYLKYDLDKSTKMLKEGDCGYELMISNKGYQCSNLTGFPKNFE